MVGKTRMVPTMRRGLPALSRAVLCLRRMLCALRGGRRSSMQKYKMWETQFRFKMQHFDRGE
jgi:hypothetical protein